MPLYKRSNLEGLADLLLIPRNASVREPDGGFYHPYLPVFDEGVRIDMFLATIGLEAAFVSLESDAPTLSEWIADEAKAFSLADWTPTPPLGENWVLLEIYDTEDGAFAMFARPQEKPDYTPTMHSRRSPEWVNRATVPGPLSTGIVARSYMSALDNMREWMLRSLPSGLRRIVGGMTCHPPQPLWVSQWPDVIELEPEGVMQVSDTAHTRIRNSLECAALWLENGGDPLQAAAEVRLALARVKPAKES